MQTILPVFLLAFCLSAAEVDKKIATSVPLPALSPDEKLHLRDTELASVRATDALNAFMQQVQQQLQRDPQYKALMDRVTAASDAYAAAIREVEAKCKAQGCSLNAVSLVLFKPEPPPVPATMPAPPKEQAVAPKPASR